MAVLTQFKATRPQSAGTGFVDFSTRHTFAYTELDGDLKLFIPVRSGRTVLEVRVHIAAAFTGATALIVGDGDTADGYLASGDVNPATLNAFANSSAIANTYKAGKYYAADGQIILDFSTGSSISAGSVVVEVKWAGYDGGVARGSVNNTGQS